MVGRGQRCPKGQLEKPLVPTSPELPPAARTHACHQKLAEDGLAAQGLVPCVTSHDGMSVLPFWATRDALVRWLQKALVPRPYWHSDCNQESQTQCGSVVLCPENQARLGPPARARSHPASAVAEDPGPSPASLPPAPGL